MLLTFLRSVFLCFDLKKFFYVKCFRWGPDLGSVVYGVYRRKLSSELFGV